MKNFKNKKDKLKKALVTYLETEESSGKAVSRVGNIVKELKHSEVFIPVIVKDDKNVVLYNVLPNCPDKKLVPIFSSEKEFKKGYKNCKFERYDGKVEMNSIYLSIFLEDVNEMGGIDGIVINPGSETFLLLRDKLEMLLKSDGVNRNISAGTDVTDAFISDISDIKNIKLKKHISKIKKLDWKNINIVLASDESMDKDEKEIFELISSKSERIPEFDILIEELKKAILIVPVFQDSHDMGFATILNENKNQLIPVFTDEKEYDKGAKLLNFSNQSVNIEVFPINMSYFINVVPNQEQIRGLIINFASDKFVIDYDFLKLIKMGKNGFIASLKSDSLK